MILFDNNNSKNDANDFWILKLYRPNEKKINKYTAYENALRECKHVPCNLLSETCVNKII